MEDRRTTLLSPFSPNNSPGVRDGSGEMVPGSSGFVLDSVASKTDEHERLPVVKKLGTLPQAEGLLHNLQLASYLGIDGGRAPCTEILLFEGLSGGSGEVFTPGIADHSVQFHDTCERITRSIGPPLRRRMIDFLILSYAAG